MKIRQYASILLHWLWPIVLATAVAGLSAFVTSRLTTPVYSASSRLLINQAPAGRNSVDYTSILTSERLAQTYSSLLTGRPVLEAAIAALNLDTTSTALGKRISVNLVRDTQLIEVTVENEDPALAARLANLIPETFSQQNDALQQSRYASTKTSLSNELDTINTQIEGLQKTIDQLGAATSAEDQAKLSRLQTELTQARQTYATVLQSYENVRLAEAQATSNVVLVEPAVAPSKPVRPRTAFNTALAALVGLILAVGVVLLIEYLDDSIRSDEQVRDILQAPVIGVVSKLAAPRSGPISLAEPRSPVVEAFRSVRTNILYAGVDKPLQRIMVTSAGPAEGKTFLASNLAVVMAQAGLRVILVDADLRRPSIHKVFNRPNRNGLTDLMLQTANGWSGVMQETAVRNLHIISSGPIPPNPSELLGSQKMNQLLDYLSQTSDAIIIDTPPILAVTDALVLARHADAVLLVVDAGTTRMGAALQAKAHLEKVGAKVLGVVMNKVATKGNGYYKYRYDHYNYYYATETAGSRNGSGRKNGTAWWWPWKDARPRAGRPSAPMPVIEPATADAPPKDDSQG